MVTTVTDPGIIQMPAEFYHADIIDSSRPSLNATTAKVLCASTPLHAWVQHPRLNPSYRPTEKAVFDIGHAAHSLILEGEDNFNANVAVVAADNYKTKAAQAARDDARAAGLAPLLEREYVEVQAMASAVLIHLAAIDATPGLFAEGKAEQTIVWEDDGVLCRARLDWLRDDLTAIDDLKSTSRTADPEQWCRSLFSLAYDVQAAFYARGVEKLTGLRPAFRFVVAETFAPYAVAVVDLGPAAVTLADRKVQVAIDTWRECLKTGVWPGYPARVHSVEMPAWEMTRWLDREGFEDVVVHL